VVWLEERDMERRVDLHGGRKVETVGRRPYDLKDLEGPEELEIELVAWPGSPNVGSLEKNLLSFLEVWGFGTPEIGVLLLRLLSVRHRGSAQGVRVLDVFDMVLCRRGRDVADGS
jgi:hypothetical protein